MGWEEVKWAGLKRLRAQFLSEEPAAGGDYWTSDEDLRDYDLTFAQRIGWKWDAVLEETASLGWRPPPGASILDWGCGTAIASRRFLAHWPAESIGDCYLWDRSARASRFAAAEVGKLGVRTVVANGKPAPSLAPAEAKPRNDEAPNLILLLSHVLNELDDKARRELSALFRRAHSIFWVEPGTLALSRRLIEFRESLRGSFQVLAPCPHQEKCGLLSPENQRHWCHHFARPPRGIFQDGNWVRFGKEMRIDLRSLPVSFLVLTRGTVAPVEASLARVIGRPRRYKGYTQALLCRAKAVTDERVRPRESPEWYEKLEDEAFTVFLR